MACSCPTVPQWVQYGKKSSEGPFAPELHVSLLVWFAIVALPGGARALCFLRCLNAQDGNSKAISGLAILATVPFWFQECQRQGHMLHPEIEECLPTPRASWGGKEYAVAVLGKHAHMSPSFPMYVDAASHKTLKIQLHGQICLRIKSDGAFGSSPGPQTSFRGSRGSSWTWNMVGN